MSNTPGQAHIVNCADAWLADIGLPTYTELNTQLEAVGAGGVESLRQRTCIGCGQRHDFHEDGTPVGGAMPCGH